MGCSFPDRDERRARAGALRVNLLETEIRGLELLLPSLAPTAPDRPRALRRLAESRLDLAAWKAARCDRAGAETLRRQSISAYETIWREHTDFDQRLEVGYYCGLEYEALGDEESARALYEGVMGSAGMQSPSDRWVFVVAGLGSGDIWLRPGAADPARVARAEEAWARLTGHPVVGKDAEGNVELRRAWIAGQRGQWAEQLRHLSTALRRARAARLPQAQVVEMYAEYEVVRAFEAHGAPGEAVRFFGGLGTPRNPGNTGTLVGLAKRYTAAGRTLDAAAVYRGLLDRHASHFVCSSAQSWIAGLGSAPEDAAARATTEPVFHTGCAAQLSTEP